MPRHLRKCRNYDITANIYTLKATAREREEWSKNEGEKGHFCCPRPFQFIIARGGANYLAKKKQFPQRLILQNVVFAENVRKEIVYTIWSISSNDFKPFLDSTRTARVIRGLDSSDIFCNSD
jgi:hypothetical protein